MTNLMQDVAAMIVDASLKAAILALVAAGGLKLLRLRNANLEHRMWTAVLVGLLLLIYWKTYAASHFRGPTRSDDSALNSAGSQAVLP